MGRTLQRTNKLATLFAMLLVAGVCSAAGWPEKPIRIIIPWPPGGSTDIIGRILAAELTTRFKQQVIIDNRAGAGSIDASERRLVESTLERLGADLYFDSPATRQGGA